MGWNPIDVAIFLHYNWHFGIGVSLVQFSFTADSCNAETSCLQSQEAGTGEPRNAGLMDWPPWYNLNLCKMVLHQYKLKRCSKKDCCKQCRYVNVKKRAKQVKENAISSILFNLITITHSVHICGIISPGRSGACDVLL